MNKQMRFLCAVVCCGLLFAGCGRTEVPAPIASSSSTSEASSYSVSSEPLSSSASSLESSAVEAPNALLSLYLSQSQAYGLLNWELEITDQEEMKLLEGLLSADNLVPLKKGDFRWTEGGSSIGFELRYSDTTVEGNCNPQAVHPIENRSTLRVGEAYYAYPREIGDKLMEFLGSKGITVRS